ncbi:MAG: glycine cleavage system aminomethyltransferase GcvT [Verrucomicrobiota bacterium]
MLAKKATLKTSPLHDSHKKLEAKMVPFSGWEMPLHYQGIIPEHKAVRESVGVFDISHMGVFEVSGTKSESWINALLTNDIRSAAVGEGQYTLMLNENGGVIDDLIIYRVEDQRFLMVVNAAKTQEDWDWLVEHKNEAVELSNIGGNMAALAIQGPKSRALIEKAFPQQSILPTRNKIFFWDESIPPLWISRTGYTGEDGFELFFMEEHSQDLWDLVLKRMEPLGGLPAGLGSRDTLRLEACLPLNGNDLAPDISPLEAGLSRFVSFDKPEKFIGSSILREQLESGKQRMLMPFVISEKCPPPRKDYELFVKGHGKPIGKATSGALSPTLGKGIGLALVQNTFAKPDQAIEIEIRGKRYKGHLTKKPLYRKTS